MELRAERLEPRFQRLVPLHLPKTPPQPGEWLAEHPELGQSFAEYQASDPQRPSEERKTIYLQPLGPFGAEQGRVLTETADFIERFYGLPVKTLPPMALSRVPEEARRQNPLTGQEQLLTSWILGSLLVPNRPADAIAYVGLTATDLYPHETWNFVFGQASLTERVGVWSIARNGDPAESPAAFRLCLHRTAAIAARELGHMLGIRHCVAYECLMNGCNHRQESDSRPFELCPACLQKLCWNTGCDPKARFERLEEFMKRHGWKQMEAYLRKAKAALET